MAIGLVADHVLQGGGLMVDVLGVDVCAMIEKQGRDVGSGDEVQWKLAIAASGMHQLGIG
jgi:hypothetical protein